MKFSYTFSNLLGTVFKEGNLIFSYDGNCVISPVGNRITIYDLKSNKVTTLPIESRYNYTALDLSPNGCILIAVNDKGEAHMISLISKTIINKHRFKGQVNAVKFSPNGRHFAICKEDGVFIFKAPGVFTGQFNAFTMERVFCTAIKETTCLEWSFDSNVLAVGSKDMTTKLCSMSSYPMYTLSSHSDIIVGVFFESNSLDVTTISRNGQACMWECSVNPEKLLQPDYSSTKKKVRNNNCLEDDDIDYSKVIESKGSNTLDTSSKINKTVGEKYFYKRLARHYLADEVRKENRDAVLTAAAYHKGMKILVAGFSTGSFFIYELPDINLIHSLSISNQTISAISINNTGEWIAIGCSGLGQLLVWEWQSYTYVLKQQGHANNIACLCYSPEGQFLATGGQDGKLKLWNIDSGFCFETIEEHSSAITAVSFGGNQKFVLSASLDGSVRAYNMKTYNRFRILTTPRPVQLSCLAVDSSGELVVAGGQDVFEIFLWSMKTGRLLEILSGHEGPVSSLAFSTLLTSTVLASVAWDKTLRIWNAIEKQSQHETIELTADGLCVAFRPNGCEVAVATLDGQISVFDVQTTIQKCSIEGRNDLGSGQSDVSLIGAKKILQSKAFTTLCYSADGNCLLAGGQSKNVCIYNMEEGQLLKRFEVTQNRSLDAMDDYINRRKMTEFGNLSLIERREEKEGGNVAISLPGVKKGDMASRSFKPEVKVFSLQFSPTGNAFAAATTEGLLVYSLSGGIVFDPWDFQLNITPLAIHESLSKFDYLNALTMSLKLNEKNLIDQVLEQIPFEDVELTVSNVSKKCIERLLVVIADKLDGSRHLEFYLNWAKNIVILHASKIENRSLPSLQRLKRSINKKYEQLSNICEYNKYTIQCVLQLEQILTQKNNKMETEDNEDELLFHLGSS